MKINFINLALKRKCTSLNAEVYMMKGEKMVKVEAVAILSHRYSSYKIMKEYYTGMDGSDYFGGRNPLVVLLSKKDVLSFMENKEEYFGYSGCMSQQDISIRFVDTILTLQDILKNNALPSSEIVMGFEDRIVPYAINIGEVEDIGNCAIFREWASDEYMQRYFNKFMKEQPYEQCRKDELLAGLVDCGLTIANAEKYFGERLADEHIKSLKRFGLW